MIGCAGEYSTAFRDDLNDSAAWDASSGLHVAPDNPAGGVIVGANARDPTVEGVCCGERPMLTFYIRIAAHAIGGATGDATTDTDGEHAAGVPGEFPLVGGPVVGGDR